MNMKIQPQILSKRRVAAQAYVFFLGGSKWNLICFDVHLAWTLNAKSKYIQDRARQEITLILVKYSEHLTPKCISF